MRLAPACYGKVPIHGDFVRHNVNGPEIDLLDQWIQAGILSSRQSLGAAWDASFDASPPQRFLFQAPRGRLVAGVVTASKDRPGRRFPFLVFTVADPATLGGDPSILPAALDGFLDRAEQEAVSGWQGRELKPFLAQVDAIPTPDSVEEGRKAIAALVAGGALQTFWQGIFGAPQDPRKYLLIHNLVETLRSGVVPRYALRLPRAATGAEVSFWIELGRKLSRRPALPTLALWGGGREGSPPGLTLLFDDLKSAYYLPAFWPERKSNLLFPLAEPAATGPDLRLQQARDKYSSVLDDATLRLSGLLTRLTT